MIVIEGNEMILKKEENVVNKLQWSIAGGNTRLITNILSESYLDELMNAFIDDCVSDKSQIIPLDKQASQYFENHNCKVLRGVDIERLRVFLISKSYYFYLKVYLCNKCTFFPTKGEIICTF